MPLSISFTRMLINGHGQQGHEYFSSYLRLVDTDFMVDFCNITHEELRVNI